MMEVQGVGKTKCEYCVSERFKDVNPIDTNVRTLHLNQAGHKLRMYSLYKTQLKFEAYLKYVESSVVHGVKTPRSFRGVLGVKTPTL